MKDFLIKIVQALVDNPEQVQINEIEGSQTVVLEVKVAKSDMGKVIGKQGRTAQLLERLRKDTYLRLLSDVAGIFE